MTVEGSEQPAFGNQQGGPGRILAEQREALGWSVEQVADQLKLAVRQVVAIEAGDYASLPPPAVVRGFVRAYAKVLRLDPVPLVAMIPADAPPAADSAAIAARREKAASMAQVRFSSSGARRRLPWGAIGGLVAAVAIGVAVWQFAPMVGTFGANGAGTSAGDAGTTVLPPPVVPGDHVTELPPPVAGAPAGAAKPADQVGSLQNPSVPLISVPPQSQPSAAAAPAPATPAAAGTPAAPAGAPVAAPAVAAPAGANALVLSAKEDSWIEVRRAKGRPLLSKLVKAGTSETVEIKEPVTLVVGKAAGVEATLRGAPLPLNPTNGTVARLSVQ